MNLLEKYKKKKPQRGIHSPEHELAYRISQEFGEPRMFAMYLGTVKRIGLDRAHQIFAEIRDSKAKTKGRLFMWKAGQKSK